MKKLLTGFAIVLISLVAGGALVLGLQSVVPDLSPFKTTSASRDTQIINAIERKEQVVLLSPDPPGFVGVGAWRGTGCPF